MDYFDDLNPYLVRQQENQTEPELPPINPGAVGQSYLGNILKLNVGKLGKFYFTYSDSDKWRDKSYVGIVEDVGRDYILIKDPNSEKRFLLSFIYLLWVEFDEELDFQCSYR